MTSPRSTSIVRMAHLVGDFGNPFYAEERQRDVWNEASAFGLQLAIWGFLGAGTMAVWVVGAPAAPYVTAALLLVGLVSGLTVAYATSLGVDLTGRDRMLRWRMLPYGLLVLALLAGLVRANASPLDVETVAGMVTGASLVLVVAALATRRRSREP